MHLILLMLFHECISSKCSHDILDSMTGAINDFIKSNFSSEIFEVSIIKHGFPLDKREGDCRTDTVRRYGFETWNKEIVDNVYRLALFDLPWFSNTYVKYE